LFIDDVDDVLMATDDLSEARLAATGEIVPFPLMIPPLMIDAVWW
jgi:hypothetical protein